MISRNIISACLLFGMIACMSRPMPPASPDTEIWKSIALEAAQSYLADSPDGRMLMKKIHPSLHQNDFHLTPKGSAAMASIIADTPDDPRIALLNESDAVVVHYILPNYPRELVLEVVIDKLSKKAVYISYEPKENAYYPFYYPLGVVWSHCKVEHLGASFDYPKDWILYKAPQIKSVSANAMVLATTSEWQDYATHSVIGRPDHFFGYYELADNLEAALLHYGIESEGNQLSVYGRGRGQVTHIITDHCIGVLAEIPHGVHFKKGGLAGLRDALVAVLNDGGNRTLVLEADDEIPEDIWQHIINSVRFQNNRHDSDNTAR